MKNTFTLVILLLLTYSIFSQTHPSTGEWNIYYGHLHNHTGFSDGKGTPDDAYSHARNVAGLDYFGISEHGILISPENWDKLKDIANAHNDDGSFVTFWGFEWSSSAIYGHISIFNTDKLTNVLSDFSFDDLKSWLSRREGIAFFNHPGREDNGIEFDHFESTPSDQFVGMELWNKTRGFERSYYNDGYFKNDGNKGYFQEALSRKWKIGAAGSHDHHSRNWGETDMATAILAKSLTRENLYEALKAKRFFSTEDRSIALSFQFNDQQMGATIPGNDLNTIKIKAFDTENEVFTKVELYKNGILFFHWDINTTNVDLIYNLSTTDTDYYYIKVTQEDGDEAISSPVFIEGGNANIPPEVTLTSPEANSKFTNGTTVVLSANATDKDGSVNKVEFYNGEEFIGESFSSPYTYTWSNMAPGDYQLVAKAIDDNNTISSSYGINISVSLSSTITVNSRVSGENDDAEEGWTGIVYKNSSDLELVNDGFLNGDQKVGIRFKNLFIPKGSIITDAYIQFTSDEKDSESTQLTIKGEKIPYSVSFSNKDISSRDVTNSHTNWNVTEWRINGEAGIKQRSPQLKSIVQEIIEQPDWSLNNPLTFIITGNGKRTAKSYDGSSSQAPLLVLNYTNVTSPAFEIEENEMLFVEDIQNDNIEEKSVTAEHVHEHEHEHTTKKKVYPNPFNDKITIKLQGKNIANVRVYNSIGELILMKGVHDNNYILNTSTLSKGIYVLAITTDDELITQKMIKQ